MEWLLQGEGVQNSQPGVRFAASPFSSSPLTPQGINPSADPVNSISGLVLGMCPGGCEDGGALSGSLSGLGKAHPGEVGGKQWE